MHTNARSKCKIMINLHKHSIKVDPAKPQRPVYERPKNTKVYYFVPYSLEYGKQNLPLKWVHFLKRWLPIELALKTMLARVSKLQNFLPTLPRVPRLEQKNFSKRSKIGFFRKLDWFFKKLEI